MISRYRDPPECPIGHPNRLIPVQFAVLWAMLHACAGAGDEESWEPPPDVRRIGSPPPMRPNTPCVFAWLLWAATKHLAGFSDPPARLDANLVFVRIRSLRHVDLTCASGSGRIATHDSARVEFEAYGQSGFVEARGKDRATWGRGEAALYLRGTA